MKKANGTVFKYGDNVDTDVIIPARYLNSSDPAELAQHCMEDIDKDFIKNVKPEPDAAQEIIFIQSPCFPYVYCKSILPFYTAIFVFPIVSGLCTKVNAFFGNTYKKGSAKNFLWRNQIVC